MMTRRFGRVILVVTCMGVLPLAAFADEVVYFANGAEMTVRSHTVDKEKQMVRLDLGGNNFIAFPIAMVDKIDSAGRNVFLNPGFLPANQVIAGTPGGGSDNSVHGTGEPAGLRRSPKKGTAGAMLGETADALPASDAVPFEESVANSRRIFNPSMPTAPGAGPQVIMPPGRPMTPIQAMPKPSAPAPPPPSAPDPEPQDSAPPGDADPENPPEAP